MNEYLSAQAIEFVGDNSKYQKRIIKVFGLQWMLFSFLIMGMPILFAPPDFLCLVQDGEGSTYAACTELQACAQKDTFTIGANSPRSLTTSFRLYCEKKYLIGLSGSMFFLGATIAGFFFPQYSEAHGRKKAIHLALFLSGTSILVAGLTQSIGQFMFFLITAGMGLNGFEILSLVYVTEISGSY